MIPQLANHIWQSTLMAGCIWLLTLLLRQNSARLRHSLWLIASAKFLLPISLLISLGASWQISRPAPVPPQVSMVLGQMTEPFAEPAHTALTPAAAGEPVMERPMAFAQ